MVPSTRPSPGVRPAASEDAAESGADGDFGDGLEVPGGDPRSSPWSQPPASTVAATEPNAPARAVRRRTVGTSGTARTLSGPAQSANVDRSTATHNKAPHNSTGRSPPWPRRRTPSG